MATPKDLCDSRHLERIAETAGMRIKSSSLSIILVAEPKLCKELGLVKEAELYQACSTEEVMAYLAGWGDRKMYAKVRKGK